MNKEGKVLEAVTLPVLNKDEGTSQSVAPAVLTKQESTTHSVAPTLLNREETTTYLVAPLGQPWQLLTVSMEPSLKKLLQQALVKLRLQVKGGGRIYCIGITLKELLAVFFIS